MRIAALADIHGNWPALQAVAADLVRQEVEVIIGLGDYIMTSTSSPRIVEWMQRQTRGYFVRGNGDSWDNYARFGPLARVDPYRHTTSCVACLSASCWSSTVCASWPSTPSRVTSTATIAPSMSCATS